MSQTDFTQKLIARFYTNFKVNVFLASGMENFFSYGSCNQTLLVIKLLFPSGRLWLQVWLVDVQSPPQTLCWPSRLCEVRA